MIINIKLYNLNAGTSEKDFEGFLNRKFADYSDYLGKLGCHCLGVYRTLNSRRNGICEIYLIEAATAAQAKKLIEMYPVPPDKIEEIETELKSFRETGHDELNLWFEPFEPSPNSRKPLDIKGKLMQFFGFTLAKGKSEKQLREFEERINNAYTEHMNKIDWNYMGVFRLQGFESEMLGELQFIDAYSPEEALAKDRDLGETEEITKIVAECRTFFAPKSTEHSFWLKPVMLTDYALEGVKLVS